MSNKCRVFGKVLNPDGSVASGKVTVYLRAKYMSVAERVALDPPVVVAPISPQGDVEFYLDANDAVLPLNSFYEVHIDTRKTSWTEKWIVPSETTEREFQTFSGGEVAPWYYVQQIEHESDIYNPHLTTIQQVLEAQPDYIIPGHRIDLGSAGVPNHTPNYLDIPTYFFEVVMEGEVTFTLPEPFNIHDINSLVVFLNGLEQKEGVQNDFRTIDPYTIEFNRPLHFEELVEVRVLKTA